LAENKQTDDDIGTYSHRFFREQGTIKASLYEGFEKSILQSELKPLNSLFSKEKGRRKTLGNQSSLNVILFEKTSYSLLNS